MVTRKLFRIITALTLVLSARGSETSARSLATQLESLPVSGNGAAAIDVVTPEVVELASRGIDFPATSTTPGFTYTYNPDLNVFERSSSSLGPALLERAETVGARRFDIGASYLFADLTQQNGHRFKGDSVPYILSSTAEGLGVRHIRYDHFSLTASVWSASATYGVTDRWD